MLVVEIGKNGKLCLRNVIGSTLVFRETDHSILISFNYGQYAALKYYALLGSRLDLLEVLEVID